jgi:hypothetical protein
MSFVAGLLMFSSANISAWHAKRSAPLPEKVTPSFAMHSLVADPDINRCCHIAQCELKNLSVDLPYIGIFFSRTPGLEIIGRIYLYENRIIVLETIARSVDNN